MFQVDVYSFGVLLCEMCITEQPQPERRVRQIAQVTNDGFRNLVSQCVHEEPGVRPNMEQIINQLEQFRPGSDSVLHMNRIQ